MFNLYLISLPYIFTTLCENVKYTSMNIMKIRIKKGYPLPVNSKEISRKIIDTFKILTLLRSLNPEGERKTRKCEIIRDSYFLFKFPTRTKTKKSKIFHHCIIIPSRIVVH